MSSELLSAVENIQIDPGWKATARFLTELPQKQPGSTSTHEGAHALRAILTNTEVLEASRVPGPGYLGRTILAGFNPIAFMAAHSLGCSGTHFDRMVVAKMGHDPDSMAQAARSILSGHELELFAVSSLIESNGTITGYQAKQAIEEVLNPLIEIELFGPEKEKRKLVQRVRRVGNHIILPDRVSLK